MPTVIVDEEGRICLPRNYHAVLDIRPGSRLVLDMADEGIIIRQAGLDARQVYLEPTTVCNLRCRTCMQQVWSERAAHMDQATFRAVLEGLRDFPDMARITFAGYGEPLMHPHLADMMRQASELGVGIGLSTNGLLLTPERIAAIFDSNLVSVVVSFDSGHIQAYKDASVHNGASLVLDNVRNLMDKAWQRRPYVHLQLGIEFVVTRSNAHMLPDLREIARQLGARYIMISNLLPHTPQAVDETLYDRDQPLLKGNTGWMLMHEEHLVVGHMKTPRMKWGAAQSCRFVSKRAMVIGQDGGVSPCYPLMHDYVYYIYGRRKQVRRHVLGNVNQRPLADIWTGEEYVRFRSRVMDFRFPSCVDCGMGCSYAEENADCWGNQPSCADCLWAQGIIRCP